ncbi:MAG: signal recognition particle protein, partial [Chloroflexi bacterium]
IMLVGLQGSGKTTHIAKLANHLKKSGRNPVMVAADVYRPAAIAQLETLGRQINVPVYSEGPDQKPLTIVRNALRQARDKGQNPILVDTAGRLQIDERMMAELEELEREIKPTEILLVADAMTGQEAVNVSQEFATRLNVSGLILTKMDGDARGGAALSIRSVTGIPIKFIGTGERMDALEPFYPERLASRILGMGDVLSLIEKAQQETSEEERRVLEERMLEGQFGLDDFLNQLQQLKRMGPLTQLLDMIPGVGSALRQQNVQVSDDDYKHIEAIIRSMTPQERRNPDIIRHSRRARIAKGSGVEQEDVTGLLKQFREMQKMMSQIAEMTGAVPGKKGGRRGVMSRMPGQLGQIGQMRDLMKQMQAGGIDPSAMGGLPPGMLGGGMPDLGKLMQSGGELQPLRSGPPSKKARQAEQAARGGHGSGQSKPPPKPRSERPTAEKRKPKKKR